MIVEPCIFISVGLFRKISQVPIFRLRVLGPIESTDLRAANWSWRLWAMEQCCKPYGIFTTNLLGTIKIRGNPIINLRDVRIVLHRRSIIHELFLKDGHFSHIKESSGT